MCFSAEASFVAGSILSITGLAAIKKSGDSSQKMFASIPLIFGVQQITEGFLWLSLQNPAYAFLQQSTTYVFLIFAQVIWPTWVPFSILLLEKENNRKKVLYFLLITGLMVSFYLAFHLLTHDVSAKIIGRHVSYELQFPVSTVRFFGILYFIATVIPPFVSSLKKMWSLGVAIFISYVITKIFYEDYVISVWCFFAAVISVSVYAIIFSSQSSLSENRNEIIGKPGL